MKISDIKERSVSMSNSAVREERKVDAAGRRQSFGEQLLKTEEQDLNVRLEELMGQIEKQGERLSRTMDVRELRAYKKLISEFMNELVSNGLKFSKHSHFDRRGRHKVYAIVKKVNEKLEELSREFLKEEKDNIKILESIGSIKGMLLDLYM